MGRLRSSTSAQTKTKRSTSRPSTSRGASKTFTTGKRTAAGKVVVIEKDKERHAYKLLGDIDTFLHFVIERHKIFERRYAGEPGPWTDDLILQKARFTNNYRVLDRDTQFVIHAVIRQGSSNFKECVFRVLLFRLFDRIETYMYLCDEFGTPTWKDFDRKAYLRALDRRKKDDFSLAGHAYQMPSPTEKTIGGVSHHDRLLRLLELMMLSDIADYLSECYELCDMQTIIALYPTMGGFLGYQVILDLNMIPRLTLPEDWALPGPGAEDGLRMIFGKQLKPDHISLALSWVHEHFDELALAAGYSRKDIPALTPSAPGLSIVDIEHVLCEFSKYVKISSTGYKFRPFSLQMAAPKVTRTLPKNWKPPRVAFMERNRRKYTNPGANKKGEYMPLAVLDKGVIDRKLYYKIRWEGWGPDADTWEPASMFEGYEVVDAFEERLSKIEALLKKYRANRM